MDDLASKSPVVALNFARSASQQLKYRHFSAKSIRCCCRRSVCRLQLSVLRRYTVLYYCIYREANRVSTAQPSSCLGCRRDDWKCGSGVIWKKPLLFNLTKLLALSKLCNYYCYFIAFLRRSISKIRHIVTHNSKWKNKWRRRWRWWSINRNKSHMNVIKQQ